MVHIAGGTSVRWQAYARVPLWLGMLSAVVIVACADEIAPTEPPVGFEFDPTRLLTDAELRTPDDPDAAVENPDWVTWIEANHEPVRSLTAEDYSDLSFFAPLLANKRVVQLGESGHGVREFSQLKVRVIKYLHEELGFDVVAIESSLYECFVADRMVGTEAPPAVLDRCAFNVWRTSAVLELFEYIEATRGTARPLRLVGMDTQVSSTSGVASRPTFFHDVVSQFDEAYADTVEAIDTNFIENHRRTAAGQHVYLLGNRDWLIPAYERLAQFLDSQLPALAAMSNEAYREGLVGAQTARSTIAFIEQLTTESTVSTEHRDLGMSANMTFITDQLYPDEKVIVWAHNFHIRHANHQIDPLPAPFTMGHWQKQRLNDEVYTIGLYMYSGNTAANDRSVYPVAQALSGSVESVLYNARRHWLFVDLQGAETSPGTGWIDGTVTANAWGVNPVSMVPRTQYDGILFVHTVTPPQYLR